MLDQILELQKPIMLFFQNLRTPFLNILAKAITFCGEAPISILMLLIIYWCVDKRKGFAFGTTLLSTNVTMNVFKVIFRVPRPWIKYPDEIDCIAKGSATGYSFPSGHSSTAGSLWGTFLVFTKNKGLKALFIALIVLVPISRVYLACHWPMDVIVGITIGLLFAFLLSKKMYALYDNDKYFGRTAVIASTVTGLIGLVTAILLEGNAIEALLWKDLMETAVMCSGLFLGAYLEKLNVGFAIPKKLGQKIVATLIGAVIGLGLWFGIKSIPFLSMIFKCIAYFFLPFWATYIYPLIAVRFGLFDKE